MVLVAVAVSVGLAEHVGEETRVTIAPREHLVANGEVRVGLAFRDLVVGREELRRAHELRLAQEQRREGGYHELAKEDDEECDTGVGGTLPDVNVLCTEHEALGLIIIVLIIIIITIIM